MRKVLRPVIVVLSVFLCRSTISFAESPEYCDADAPDFSTVVGTIEKFEKDTLTISVPLVRRMTLKTVDDRKKMQSEQPAQRGTVFLPHLIRTIPDSDSQVTSSQARQPDPAKRGDNSAVAQPVNLKTPRRQMFLKISKTSINSHIATYNSEGKKVVSQRSAKTGDFVAGQSVDVIYAVSNEENVLLSAVVGNAALPQELD